MKDHWRLRERQLHLACRFSYLGLKDSGDLTYNRQDFWVTTSNKQLNFLQQIRTRRKEALDNLPDPDLLAGDIIENLEAGIESFKEIYAALK